MFFKYLLICSALHFPLSANGYIKSLLQSSGFTTTCDTVNIRLKLRRPSGIFSWVIHFTASCPWAIALINGAPNFLLLHVLL